MTPLKGRAARFGVVGTGRMAAAMVATLRSAGAEVMAVASRDEARAASFAKEHGVASAHGDWRVMIRRSDIDAVYVANAPSAHAEVAIAALGEGKATLCEKPLAADPVMAAQIANAARLSGTLCMEAIWTAFLPSHRRFVSLAASGACGRPVHFRADFGYPEPPSSRLFEPDGAGVLLDRAVYVVALALRVMGPVVEVSAQVDRDAAGLDRHAALTLRHEGGGVSQLGASFVALTSNSAHLAGTAGSLALEEPLLGSESVIARAAKIAPETGAAGGKGGLMQALKRSEALRRLKAALPAGRRERLSYGADPHLLQVQHFIDLMREGRAESDVAPLSLSIEALRVIGEAGRVAAPSARIGRPA